jgi:HSP20 family protein
MLMRFDPWREFDRLTRDLFNGSVRTSLPIDAYRKDDEFVIHFDLPGIDSDSIDLTVDENVLTVRAERRAETTEGVEVLVSERPQGTYVRRIFLGEVIDADKLSARYDNGVLTVVAPISESAKPRKIEIAAGNGTPALEAKTSRA